MQRATCDKLKPPLKSWLHLITRSLLAGSTLAAAASVRIDRWVLGAVLTLAIGAARTRSAIGAVAFVHLGGRQLGTVLAGAVGAARAGSAATAVAHYVRRRGIGSAASASTTVRH